MTVLKTEVDDTSSPPPGWSAKEHSSLRGIRVRIGRMDSRLRGNDGKKCS